MDFCHKNEQYVYDFIAKLYTKNKNEQVSVVRKLIFTNEAWLKLRIQKKYRNNNFICILFFNHQIPSVCDRQLRFMFYLGN